MSKKRVLALVAAALVAGLALGNIVGAFAAPAADSTSAGTGVVAQACDLGLRMGSAVREAGGRLVDVVAKLTGLTATEVAEKRADGQSIAQIAESKGVSTSEVVDEALDTREALLAEKVKSGVVTQEQADQALANMKTRITERVQSTQTGPGAGRGGGMGGGRGAGRGGCNGTCGCAAPQAGTATQ